MYHNGCVFRTVARAHETDGNTTRGGMPGSGQVHQVATDAVRNHWPRGSSGTPTGFCRSRTSSRSLLLPDTRSWRHRQHSLTAVVVPAFSRVTSRSVFRALRTRPQHGVFLRGRTALHRVNFRVVGSSVARTHVRKRRWLSSGQIAVARWSGSQFWFRLSHYNYYSYTFSS